MQREYFGCIGCGRMFKLDEFEIAEYGAHDCDDPEIRLIRNDEPRSIRDFIKGLFRR